MKEPPDRWHMWVGAAMAFVLAVVVLVLIALALFVNSHVGRWD